MRTTMRFILFAMAALGCLMASAQLPDDLRTEQIYLAPDRQWFDAGDTIGVQGVVTCLAHNQIAPYSRILYLEFIDERDSVQVRQRLACDSVGRFFAQVPTDDLFTPGVYYMRAYTTLMRNFSDSGFAYMPLICGKRHANDSHSLAGVQCHIAPAGGVLATGRPQNVVVMLQSMSGFPIMAQTVSLVDSESNVLSSAVTSPSGVATLGFVPQAGMKYRVMVGDEASTESHAFAVPDAVPGATKINATLSDRVLRFGIDNLPSDKSKLKFYAYDRENGLLQCGEARSAGTIQLGNSAIVSTLMLADDDMNVLAQCTVAQRKLADRFSAAAQTDTLPCGVAISAAEVMGLPQDSCSVVVSRIVNADDPWAPTAEEALLYGSDYTSALPFPTSFLQSTPRQRAADLQAWLSTSQLSRFDLKEVMNGGASVYAYMPEMVMTLHGTALNDNLHPYKDGRIVAYRTDNSFAYDTIVGGNGKFCIAVDNYPEDTEFFVQYITKNGKMIKANLRFDDDTYPAPTKGGHRWAYASQYAQSDNTVGDRTSWDDLQLPEITVRARVHSDKRNVTERFYGNSYKDRDEIKRWNCRTLFEILQKIPQLYAYRTPMGDYVVLPKRGVSVMKHAFVSNTESGNEANTISNLDVGNIDAGVIPVLVDGSKYTGKQTLFAFEMPAEEIETVEYLQPWQANAVTFGALSGAIVVTTRGYKHPEKLPSKGTFYRPVGLAEAKQSDDGLHAPSVPGNYRLIVDVIGAEGVKTYGRNILVVKP